QPRQLPVRAGLPAAPAAGAQPAHPHPVPAALAGPEVVGSAHRLHAGEDGHELRDAGPGRRIRPARRGGQRAVAAHPDRHRRAQHDPRRRGRQRAQAGGHGRRGARRPGARRRHLQRQLLHRRRSAARGRHRGPVRLRGRSRQAAVSRPVPRSLNAASWDHGRPPAIPHADEIPAHHGPRARPRRLAALLLRRSGPARNPPHGKRGGPLHAGLPRRRRDPGRGSRADLQLARRTRQRRGLRQRPPLRPPRPPRRRPLRHRPAPAGHGLHHPPPAARRPHGVRALARPDLGRTAAGRPPAAAGAVGIDAEHGDLVMARDAGVEELLALGRDRLLPVYRQREMILERGRGARVWDSEGREYVDFGAGIAVCSLGHCDPELTAALTEQAGRLWHTSNVFYTEPPLRLAQELVDASRFARRAFLCNSGAEANEAAIKLVRRWATAQGRAPERRVIVTFRGSFHGRTLAAVTATAQPKYQEGYEPLPGGFRYVDFNDIAQLEAAMAAGDVAAVMLEPAQGEGGVMPAAPGYLQAVRALCDRHDALLVLDEIQCGMGRTGTLFAHWQDQATPDIVTLAKALGGGMPIGALLAGPKVAETMQFGAHGTTFGGNPLAAAVARVALRRLASDDIAANVARQSQAIRDGVEAINRDLGLFAAVRGRGLMLGAVLKPEHA